jgi:HEPN domain-containing protein
MVCAAFSLELYFKCLIRLGRKSFGREHDLAKLFALIGRRNRAKIRKYWNDHSGTVRSYLDQAYGGDAPKIDFDFALSASKDAFVTMRYIYECGIEPNKGWLADTIAEGTRTTILDKYPEWENARQTSPLPETSFPW